MTLIAPMIGDMITSSRGLPGEVWRTSTTKGYHPKRGAPPTALAVALVAAERAAGITLPRPASARKAA